MKAPDETSEGTGKSRLFKSKKELIMLAISSTVFAFVIYKMYLSKGSKGPAVAELTTAAAVAPAPARQAADPKASPGPPAEPPAGPPAATPDLLALIELAELDDPGKVEAPPRPARDPFAMSKLMHNAIYEKDKGRDPKAPTASKIVTLTAKNLKETLAGIPGAEDAAKSGLKLGAIMITGSWQGATINGKVRRRGDTILGFKLVKVLQDSVILELGQHRVRLLVRPRSSWIRDK